ncbi:hypothetical protein [Breoghania sp. JC706]|uniref:hypothetical protein n=1 Tax=Breoghania sp. JC706 TaxID=3117732 RepID=UPI003008FC23
MDAHSELHAVLAELRTSAERAEAALSKVQLRRDPRFMPPPGMLATLALAALPATVSATVSAIFVPRADAGHDTEAAADRDHATGGNA